MIQHIILIPFLFHIFFILDDGTQLDTWISDVTLCFDKSVQQDLRMRNHRMQNIVNHETSSMWKQTPGLSK
jgi:hypothetical protein